MPATAASKAERLDHEEFLQAVDTETPQAHKAPAAAILRTISRGLFKLRLLERLET
jgi:hypothetical protein